MLQGNVLLISKNGFFRQGLRQALAADTLSFVGEEFSPTAALVFLQSGHQNVDLIVFDADAADGSTSLTEISDRYPQISMVMLSADQSSTAREQAAEFKAKALLPNTISAEALNLTLQLVILGEDLFLATGQASGGINPAPRSPAGAETSARLSPRETEILRFIKQGAPNKLIARQLDIAEATIKVHVKSVLRKIDVGNRTQAAIWAMSHLDAA
jgi:two-component system nitrate/nitrite response regulator NarL